LQYDRPICYRRNRRRGLKEKLKTFLIGVLDDSAIRIETDKDGKETEKGIYQGWAIAQVKAELGVIEEI